MNDKEFVEKALQTESREWQEIMPRICDIKVLRLMHAAMGMVTESAEFLDVMKEYIFYGKPLDEVNMAEEMGDNFWYSAIGANAMGLTFEQIWQAVINKLSERYGKEFGSDRAINRDLLIERSSLEASLEKDLK